MTKKLLLMLGICLVYISLVNAYDTDEYLNEFSIEGENCDVIDIFAYKQVEERWWNKYHLSQTIPVLYYCCKEEECVAVFADVQGKSLMKDYSYYELIDLNYIKYSIVQGNLTITSFVSTGIDSCYYHGGDKLRSETLNLVADTAEKIALAQKTKKAKQVVDFVGTARSLNIISPFNLADFGLSVACKYNNNKIKKAVEKLTECNLYLSNIKNNYAEAGYVNRLGTCLDEAREDFKIYRQDKLAMVKHGFDKGANTGKAIWNFFGDLSNDPKNALSNFKVEDTEYDTAGKIYEEIKDKKLYMHNPRKDSIYQKYASRILSKRADYNSIRTEVENQIIHVSNITPNFLTVFFTDLFYKPNFNISQGKILLSDSKKAFYYCNQLRAQDKYNSAIKCQKETKSWIDDSTKIVEREVKIARNFDKRWKTALIIFGILVAAFLFIKFFILNNSEINVN